MRLRGFGFPPKMFLFPRKMFFFPRKMFFFYVLCDLLFWKTIPISMGFFKGHFSLTSPVKCSFFTPRVVLPGSGFLKKMCVNVLKELVSLFINITACIIMMWFKNTNSKQGEWRKTTQMAYEFKTSKTRHIRRTKRWVYVHPMKSLNAENRGGFEGMERIRQVHFQKTGIKNPPTTSARGFLSCKHLLNQALFKLFPLVKLLFCAAYSFVIRGQKISDFLLFFKARDRN